MIPLIWAKLKWAISNFASYQIGEDREKQIKATTVTPVPSVPSFV
jgi:hypothetical protein